MKATAETTSKEDLGGVVSLELIPGMSLNDFCARHIENYDPDRLEVLALRFHYGKESALIVYAVDNEPSAAGNEGDPVKGPVRKFKITSFSIQDILSFVSELNLTLTTGIHALKDLDEINKSSDDSLEIRESEKTDLKTMVSCTNMLNKLGFTTQFKAFKAGLKSLDTEHVYAPNEVTIVNFYRFEGDSDPEENSILYAIETSKGEKGTLTDAYGVYSDPCVSDFIKQVEEIEKKTDRDESL